MRAVYESPQILTVKKWPSIEEAWLAGKLLITRIIWFLTLLGDFFKAFYLPCMSRIGKRSLAKAGFTAGTNNSSLFCHIYEFKLQRKQQITYNNSNCVQIGHFATCRVGDTISLLCPCQLCSPFLALPRCPLQELPDRFCNNLPAPQSLSLLQLKNMIFYLLEGHLYMETFTLTHIPHCGKSCP